MSDLSSGRPIGGQTWSPPHFVLMNSLLMCCEACEWCCLRHEEKDEPSLRRGYTGQRPGRRTRSPVPAPTGSMTVGTGHAQMPWAAACATLTAASRHSVLRASPGSDTEQRMLVAGAATMGCLGPKGVLCVSGPGAIRSAAQRRRTRASHHHGPHLPTCQGPGGSEDLSRPPTLAQGRTPYCRPRRSWLPRGVSMQHPAPGSRLPSSFWGTKKQPDARFKNKLCRREKRSILPSLPSCLNV